MVKVSSALLINLSPCQGTGSGVLQALHKNVLTGWVTVGGKDRCMRHLSVAVCGRLYTYRKLSSPRSFKNID